MSQCQNQRSERVLLSAAKQNDWLITDDQLPSLAQRHDIGVEELANTLGDLVEREFLDLFYSADDHRAYFVPDKVVDDVNTFVDIHGTTSD